MALLRVLLFFSIAHAADYYVDYEKGDNGRDGTTLKSAFKTVAKALTLCEGNQADQIHILPSALPIRDMIAVSGKKYSSSAPLVIDGGDNWFIGTENLPATEWKPHSYIKDVYVFPGYTNRFPVYFFVVNGKPVRMGRARLHQKNPLPAPENLEPNEWSLVDADLLLRIQEGYGISEYQCERVQREAGIQFSSASSTFVVISNIKTKFVWNDGINLHCKKDPLDNSRDIFFHNVNASWNWDEGISAHDSFEYTLSNAVMIGNNYGLVNVESSKGVHYDLLLADSLDNEINFYTSPESLEGSNVFINSFVCFSKSHKHLTSVSKTMTPSTLAFENSVLLFPNSNPTNFTFSLSGLRVIFDRTTLFHSADRPFVAGGLSGPVDLDLRSSLFYFKNPSTLFSYTSSEAKMRSHSTLFAGVSSFILSGAKYDPRNQSALQQATGGDTNTRFTGGDVKIESGSFQVEGRGADLSPSMKMRVKKYFDSTLLGAGFSLLSREILSSSMRFTFNLPVEALSLRAGIRIQDEKGFPVPDVDFVFSNGGKTVLVNRLKPGHRVLLTENLLSTLGPIGLIKLESFVAPTN